MRLTRRSLLTTAVLTSGSLILAACGSANGGMGNMPGMDHGAMGTATMPVAGEYDQMFIDMMVPHHQGAIDMATIAKQQAEHAELQQLATAIVTDQDGEIARMKVWRQAWYGSDQIPPGMGGHQMAGMDTDLAQLASARPFDRAFIDAMIPHHQSAIDMAREGQTRAVHQEVRDLAAQIIVEQQREIDQMRAWRAQWYPM